jgi:integrase
VQTIEAIAPYDRFLASLSKSSQTREKYKIQLDYYLKWLNVNDANDLITPTLIDSPAEIRQTEDMIIKHIEYLRDEKKLSSSTINVRLFAILRFYRSNRININRAYIATFKPAQRKRRNDQAWNHAQIAKMLEYSRDPRQRAIILLLCSTGMRIGGLRTLTFGAITRVELDKQQHIYKIKVYAQEREEYYTFTTPEAANALDVYLDWRVRVGEKLSLESPLIRKEFDPIDSWQVRNPKFIKIGSILSLIDKFLIQCGMRSRTNKKDRHLHDVMMSHGFRKFFVTCCKKVNVNFSDREFFVGHSGYRGLDVNYDRTSEEDRLAEYLKAVDLLTISNENRLRRKVEEQGATIDYKLQEKDLQISKLTRQMAQMQQTQEEMQVLLRNPKKLMEMMRDQ